MFYLTQRMQILSFELTSPEDNEKFFARVLGPDPGTSVCVAREARISGARWPAWPRGQQRRGRGQECWGLGSAWAHLGGLAQPVSPGQESNFACSASRRPVAPKNTETFFTV